MVWLLTWVVLVLGAAGVFLLLGRHLWRTGRTLARDLGEAADRLTAITDRLAELDGSQPAPGQPRDVPSEGSSPRPRR